MTETQTGLKTSESRTKHYLAGIICVLAAICIDQWTKYLAVLHLKQGNSLVLIKDVFVLHYLENRGAAFGLFQNQKLFFIVSAVIVLGAAVWFYMRVPMNRRFLPIRLCVLFICAGAIGNMIDRLRLNYVVDFFYFELIDFPIFNVADIYVTCGAVLFLIFFLLYYKEEDLDALGNEIFPRRKKRKE